MLNIEFGIGGYAKFYFKDIIYEQFLQELRILLQNQEIFCEIQRKYIKELKTQGK